ncbi:MAG: protein kinase [Sandaracinaceae bacterium]|nr:protein kinase [Sandaracinaceae bacterium]
MPVLTTEERVGTVLAGKYRLERVIGRGGMGDVLAGTHTWSGRAVAVKLVRPSCAAGEARVLREAQAAARVRHPNVVDVIDVGIADDGTFYLVMDRLRGEDLGRVLARHGRLGAAETVAIVAPLLDALATLHRAAVVHRDVKPSNVFLSREGDRVVPKLLDFGIARLEDGPAVTHGAPPIGTPQFAAPEQLRGAPVDARSDLWSVAALAYACLEGEAPFEAPTAAATSARALTEPPPVLAADPPRLGAAVAAVLSRGLARDPSERPASALAFRAELAAAARRDETPADELALAALLDETAAPSAHAAPTTTAGPSGPTPARAAGARGAIVMAGALAVAGLAALALGGASSPPARSASVAAPEAPSELAPPGIARDGAGGERRGPDVGVHVGDEPRDEASSPAHLDRAAQIAPERAPDGVAEPTPGAPRARRRAVTPPAPEPAAPEEPADEPRLAPVRGTNGALILME